MSNPQLKLAIVELRNYCEQEVQNYLQMKTCDIVNDEQTTMDDEGDSTFGDLLQKVIQLLFQEKAQEEPREAGKEFERELSAVPQKSSNLISKYEKTIALLNEIEQRFDL